MVDTSVMALASSSIARDERAVDLQHLHGQAGEIRERGIAGAEVVDRDVDAELADREQLGDVRGARLP